MLISLLVIFMISFILLFLFIFKGNKQEPEEEKLNLLLVILVSFILALAPTVAMGIILFVLLGSVNIVNFTFSLHIRLNELIILAISFFAYLLTIDSIIEIIVKHILGKNTYYYIAILLIRIGVFYIIGDFIGLTQTASIVMATGVAITILFIEILYELSENRKMKQMDTNE